MGTAYGLEASLAPVPSEHPGDDPAYNDQDAWLRPR